MKETIKRIQNWYKLNCNGDWEHSYGFSIATLDNPGWAIRIDLSETPLEGLDFQKVFQNIEYEHDWFHIKTTQKVLEIACGPENLKQVFNIFLDELIPQYSDPNFYYDIFLPLEGHKIDIWTPAKARMLNEESIQIMEIEEIEYKKIKVCDVEQIDFDQSDLEKLQLNYKVGDILGIDIQEVFDGLILTIKNKN